MSERRYRAAEVAEHLDITESEFAGWLAGEQGDDWPPPSGTDDDGPYWGVDDLSAWVRWFEEG
jgi:hypothetical protein